MDFKGNVLLVNSPLFRESQHDYDENVIPPMGLAYIASNLKDNGIYCNLLDAVYHKMGVKEICQYFSKTTPSFVGINIFTTNMHLVKEIVEKCQIRTTFIIGGQAARFLYQEIFNWNTNNKIIVIIGEADFLFSALVQDNDNAISFEKERKNPPRELFKVDAESPFFPREISDLHLHREFLENEPSKNKKGYKEAFIIASRGCKYSCAFCAAAKNLNKDIPIRRRSAQSIKNEIAEIQSLYNGNVNAIRVLDDLFLRDIESIKLAGEIFNKSGLSWRSMAHVLSFKDINVATLCDLRKSGCIELFIGVESGSEEILKKIKKFHNIIKIKETFKKVFQAGISIKAYFIYGFPGETENNMSKTFELAIELKNYAKVFGVGFRASAFKFRLYHGTKIYNDFLLKNSMCNIKIMPDNTLSNITGRNLFNFTSGNYSAVSDDCLNKFVEKTNILKTF